MALALGTWKLSRIPWHGDYNEVGHGEAGEPRHLHTLGGQGPGGGRREDIRGGRTEENKRTSLTWDLVGRSGRLGKDRIV